MMNREGFVSRLCFSYHMGRERERERVTQCVLMNVCGSTVQIKPNQGRNYYDGFRMGKSTQ